MIEERITYTQVYDDIHCAELAQYGCEIAKYIQASTSIVHHIIDATNIGAFPLHISHYRAALNRLARADSGWVVVVSTHPLLNAALDVIMNATGVRLHLAQTFDDALAFLSVVDDSLAAEPVPIYETIISQK
ncbi:MAG: hypothetical protein D6737_02910 [Chloroflexi bacterium]|nr:MAG: hypothetical protein CUN54_08115 [Phototrophicales bacterium]RMF82133.1 MAG: hypothetical protein D6737_02910 [Chloroflexota bacterium]